MKKIIKAVFWTVTIGGLSWFTVTQLSKNKAKLEANSQLAQVRNTTIPVITARTERMKQENHFEVVGNFAPWKSVVVTSEAAGKIVQLNMDNGIVVQAGAVLAVLDSDLPRIQLETARINLAKAENDLTRLKNLLGEGGVTQQQIDDASLGVENLKAQIRSIEKQISMMTVKAPIAGIISNKSVEKGSLVSPGMPLAHITNISRLKMQVYLTEDQIIHVKKRQRIRLTADLFPSRPLSGIVSFIDVNADASRRFLTEIEIENSDNLLRAGMTGTAYLEGSIGKEVLAIAREAIIGSLRDARVYVAEDGIARLKSVTTGAVFGNRVEIISGLTEGQTVVVSGQINLQDGMAVEIH